MARGEQPPGSDLPAPYRSPWRAFAEALAALQQSIAALAADLALELRRLLRRNRQGELPRPGFWPESLAALFWPLLLALLLALSGVVIVAARATLAPRGGVGAAAPAAASGPGPSSDGSSTSVAATASGSPGVPPPTTGPADGASPSSSRAAAAGKPAEQPEAPAPLQLDPLLALLTEGEDAGLLLAVTPDAAASQLSLILSPAGEALPEPALRQAAERWQRRAREAGYERLELRDRQGHLRGRQALVGSGMILLAPIPAA